MKELDNVEVKDAYTSSKDVLVEILLNGGYSYKFTVKSDAALLRSLIAVFLARTQGKKDSFLFQIPIQENQASLCFSSDQLVGIITNPPMLISRNSERET